MPRLTATPDRPVRPGAPWPRVSTQTHPPCAPLPTRSSRAEEGRGERQAGRPIMTRPEPELDGGRDRYGAYMRCVSL